MSTTSRSGHLAGFEALPEVSDRLTLPGFALGHGTDPVGKTGVTVILCPEGATAAAEVRGSATGTRQFDSITNPLHLAQRAHGVVLAGGSGMGLGATAPVVEALEARGIGFDTGYGVVPLLPTAILFDLAFGDPAARPTPALGLEALAAAEAWTPGDRVPVGSVGAGTGATVGKARGPDRAMKGGFGFASCRVPRAGDDGGGGGGPTVAAAVAVNAFGDVRHPDTGRPIAGCRRAPGSLERLSGAAELAGLPEDFDHRWEGNTTLAVVMTDAALTKTAALKVCHMAFGAFYRALDPGVSLYDGDLVVTLSQGDHRANVNQIGVLAQHVLGRAIVTAVEAADGFGLLPAVRDLPAGGAP